MTQKRPIGVRVVLIASITTVSVYGSYRLVPWLAGVLKDINPTIITAILASFATIVTSVYVSTFNARRAAELAAQEANRTKKAEAYNEFIKILLAAFTESKAKKKRFQETSEKLSRAFLKFTSTIVIYGSPSVIKVFGEWRQSADDPHKAIVLVDRLLREMRSDLGESNKGIVENDILSLFIVGGKTELDRIAPRN